MQTKIVPLTKMCMEYDEKIYKETKDMILTEFDPTKKAAINPEDIINPVEGIPEVAISCYSNTTFESMLSELETEIIAMTSTANGVTPIHRAKYKGADVALFMMDVGAPMSVKMGCEKFGQSFKVGGKRQNGVDCLVRKQTCFPKTKTLSRFMIVYNLGVALMSVMMLVRGVIQVLNVSLSQGASAAISGIAGVGHIMVGTGIILLLVSLKKAEEV